MNEVPLSEALNFTGRPENNNLHPHILTADLLNSDLHKIKSEPDVGDYPLPSLSTTLSLHPHVTIADRNAPEIHPANGSLKRYMPARFSPGGSTALLNPPQINGGHRAYRAGVAN
ncbi:hypothetical protein HUJ04_005581 [Dendroctonus ponderosae]|nr:hypothetical protein HUJ04_005581 [Dendroctonus ponderosae]